MSTIYEFTARLNSGEDKQLQDYSGKVLLIVNTASACGFTPQYEGLQQLYTEYKEQGFEILGFPCNQFGSQEKGNDGEIQSFCSLNFGVNFPLFSKIDVNGDDAHPLYKHLKKEAPGILGTKAIKWNFTKFLISKDGQVIKRYGSATKPAEIKADITKQLNS